MNWTADWYVREARYWFTEQERGIYSADYCEVMHWYMLLLSAMYEQED